MSSAVGDNVQHMEEPPRPQRRPSTPNAQSKEITVAQGSDTKGIVNQHPSQSTVERESGGNNGGTGTTGSTSTPSNFTSFRVGVSEDRNRKCRRTMEDAHAFVYDFGGVKGQGYFAVFDGHAGKETAEWCGANFHKYLLQQLRTSKEGQPSQPIPDLLNETFHIVDSELSKLAAKGGTRSGCTAVTAFLRLEDENGNAVKLDNQQDGASDGVGKEGSAAATNATVKSQEMKEEPKIDVQDQQPSTTTRTTSGDKDIPEEEEEKRKFGDGLHRDKFRSFFGGTTTNSSSSTTTSTPSINPGGNSADPSKKGTTTEGGVNDGTGTPSPPALPLNLAKRTLYTANVGDARAVLCRGGKAVRLTYDHKGSDAQEAKRITDAGGFVMNNRVNGVLAVTRSLGDSSMKEFVVGSPYTTETTLGDDDEFLIIACDGLWDVTEDQDAVDLIRDVKDAQEASRVLLDHALTNFSTDNLSVLVVALQTSLV